MSTAETFIKLALDYDVLKFGDFKLKSGRQSPYFFNAGLFNTGHALKLLGQLYADALGQSGIEYDMIFGPAYKGIPLVSTLAVALADAGHDVPYCFDRKEPKAHGEGGNLVGAPLQGRVVVVDDLITAGTAINGAVELIQQEGATLAGIVIGLDRGERGQGKQSAVAEVAERYGVPVVAIAQFADLLQHLQNTPELQAHAGAMEAYFAEFGAG